jgi:hypothetical protein
LKDSAEDSAERLFQIKIEFFFVFNIDRSSHSITFVQMSECMLYYDLSLGSPDSFLSGPLISATEDDSEYDRLPRVLPLSDPVAKPWKQEQASRHKQLGYIHFKSRFSGYDNLSEDKMYMTFNFTMDVYKYADSLIWQSDQDYAERQAEQQEVIKAAERRADEQRNAQLNEGYIFIKGRHWKKFNGFMNLSKGIYPIGEFAARCHRCATFGVFRGLIACYVLTNVNGKYRQCMTELCAHCFWTYRKIQLHTTSELGISTDLMNFVYSLENKKYMIHTNRMLYRDVTKNSIFPETNVWIKPYDSDLVYGLFKTMEYPTNPPRAIRYRVRTPDWDTSTMYEMEKVVHDQERRIRKRHHEEAFASEHGLPYEGPRSRVISQDFDSDIQQILVSDDNVKRSRLRKKVVGLEIFDDSTKKIIRKAPLKIHPKQAHTILFFRKKPKNTYH